MKHRRWIPLVLLLMAARLDAQSAIRGSIRADATRRTVSGVIVLEPGTRTFTTTSSGEFLFGDLPAGSYQLSFRAIGFNPFHAVAELSGRDTVEVDVELVPAAQQIAPLSVTAVDRFRSGRMEEFDRRRSRGFGTFIDRAILEHWDHASLPDILRMASGVNSVVIPQRCDGGGFAVAAGRHGLIVLPPSMRCDHPLVPACYLDVFMDGARLWHWGEGIPPNMAQYDAREFQAIEIYRGRSEIPPEFATSETECGAIVLWRRTGEAR